MSGAKSTAPRAHERECITPELHGQLTAALAAMNLPDVQPPAVGAPFLESITRLASDVATARGAGPLDQPTLREPLQAALNEIDAAWPA